MAVTSCEPRMTNVKLKTPYKNWLPPLSKAKGEALEASIKLEGVRDAILVDPDGNVIDGHHRLRIDPNAPRRVVEGKTPAELKALVWGANRQRRHLTPDQGCEADPEYAGPAKQTAYELNQDGKTQADIAALMGVARSTIEAWLAEFSNDSAVNSKPPPVKQHMKLTQEDRAEILERREKGDPVKVIAADKDISKGRVTQVAQSETIRRDCAIERERLRKAQAKIPPSERRYATIVIDPPWAIQKIERDQRPNQAGFDYPTMSVDEIEAWGKEHVRPLPDAHLYLWVTPKYLPSGFRLAEAWDFKYQCLLTWVKSVGFTPFYWMYSTEHVLFCRRGSLDLLKKGVRLDFTAKRREHSRKPDEFYDIVRKVSPEPRVEMFSREEREGFDRAGNDTGKF